MARWSEVAGWTDLAAMALGRSDIEEGAESPAALVAMVADARGWPSTEASRLAYEAARGPEGADEIAASGLPGADKTAAAVRAWWVDRGRRVANTRRRLVDDTARDVQRSAGQLVGRGNWAAEGGVAGGLAGAAFAIATKQKGYGALAAVAASAGLGALVGYGVKKQ